MGERFIASYMVHCPKLLRDHCLLNQRIGWKGTDLTKFNLKDLSLEGLQDLVADLGQPQYRARQLAEWVFQKDVASFDDMSNLPASLRTDLDRQYTLGRLRQIKRLVSNEGETEKYLFGLSDGNTVESVLMRHDYGSSACVSTQVGCRMGCVFCASSLGGWVRNLTPGEIYDQVLAIRRSTGADVQRVVIMGTGEPLDNLDHTLVFIRNITADYGLGISTRRITLSTCGLVPEIGRLANSGLGVTLAVSLHAPNDDLRNRIVPVNRRYPLAQLIRACGEYTLRTGRRVTFEYALIQGLNDAPGQANALTELLRGLNCHVNLIPVNYVPERGSTPPDPVTVRRFQEVLELKGIPVTVRREMGADINAACGQLRTAASSQRAASSRHRHHRHSRGSEWYR
ncbi:MAG: 23S rRNA (adenine(2503)-C(2))-methyltransferase RlmN [Clostridia bacterium]|nr:23S rRNA (adenine(2503)-C(2))-methyltransferase RlmN [Clostridia bacterium]